MKKSIVSVSLIAAVSLLAGCAQPMTQGYMLPSSLVGAGLGAIIDEDDREEGALIGAVLGAGVGGMADVYRSGSVTSQSQYQQGQYQNGQYQQGQCWTERRGNGVVQICPQGQSGYSAPQYSQQGYPQGGYGQGGYAQQSVAQAGAPSGGQCRNEQEFTGQYDAQRQPNYRMVRRCYGQQSQGGYSQGGYASQSSGNSRYYQP